MNKRLFQTNLRQFLRILHKNAMPSPRSLQSHIYLKGMRNDFALIEKYCQKDLRILDFGCGMGDISLHLASFGYQVTGIDVKDNPETKFSGREDLQPRIWQDIGDKFGVNFSFYDGDRIPFASKSFDSVVAYAVIEHLPPGKIAPLLGEIKRVLRPKGYFLIFRCPRYLSLAEWLAQIVGRGHHVLIKEKELKTLLRKQNFEIIKWERTDMIIGILPGIWQKIWNILSFLLFPIDWLLLKTPLKYLAHHMRIVSQKPASL